jgi:hypothetical protein
MVCDDGFVSYKRGVLLSSLARDLWYFVIICLLSHLFFKEQAFFSEFLQQMEALTLK